VMLESRHEDNPTIWDRHHRAPTAYGAAYLAKLNALTGVRLQRYRFGKWVQAEGVVYPHYDPHIHRITLSQMPSGWQDWPTRWIFDFGFTDPFVWQEWTRSPESGSLYRLREIYRTKRLVEDHCADIKALKPKKPQEVICDHDAEGRATLERHLGVRTIPAYKAITAGVQAVSSRLGRSEPEEDLPPVPASIFWLRDALIHEPDPLLVEAKLPLCTEEEFDVYQWNTTSGRKKGEEPIDKFNHGMDCNRYMVAHVDEIYRAGPKPRFRPL
jgi:hypothetical protein